MCAVPLTGTHLLQVICCAFALSLASIARAQSPTFAAGVSLGTVNGSELWEASGLVASRQNSGLLWSHNDNGYPGTIIALLTNGTILAHYSLPEVYGGDFEDIAIGPGPNPAFSYIYLGDTEPAAYAFASGNPPWLSVGGAQQIVLSYPDGAHNAEAMLVDPLTGDLFIFTKLDSSSKVYRATRAEMNSGQPITLAYLREITFRKPSAADISDDGKFIVLRRGSNASLWVRGANQTVDEALGNSSSAIPLVSEVNGEAIGFAPNATGYYTISEGSYQAINWFARSDTTPAEPRVFLPAGATWVYDDYGDPAGDDWFTTDYAEDFYDVGLAPFGFNSSEQTTTYNDVAATYFRAHFSVSNTNGLTNLALRVCFNDGIAAYLNGTEILRQNLVTDATPGTPAASSRDTLRQQWTSFPVNPALLHLGDNVLAVEVHSVAGASSMNFDAQLVEARVDTLPRFVGAPQRVGNKWQLRLSGPVGRTVTIQKSPNLTTWTNLGSVLLTNGTGTLLDSSGGSVGFYRFAP
jgi:hypothetical protein